MTVNGDANMHDPMKRAKKLDIAGGLPGYGHRLRN